MAEHLPDLDLLRADDALLDALGHGERPAGDDPLAAMFEAWRADLDDAADRPAAADDPDVDGGDDAGGRGGGVDPGIVALPRHRAGRSRWRSRSVRFGVGAAVVIAVAGGTSVAAASAGPNSPLWPITRIVNPERAGAADVERQIDAARQAIAERRPDEARRLLDRATQLLARVHDPDTVTRLSGEIDALRTELDTTVPASPRPPSGTGRAATPTPTPAPGGAPGTPAHSPSPSPSPSPSRGGGLLPLPLPTGLLPSLPFGLADQ